MSLTEIRQKLMALIQSTDDRELLEWHWHLLRKSLEGHRDWYEELSAEQRQMLQESLESYERGESKDHEQVRERYRKWL
jgi:hypothetical protein